MSGIFICILLKIAGIHYDGFEVIEMSFFNMITALEKERTEQIIAYYYEIDGIKFSKETSGIIMIDLDLFDNLPNHIDDYKGSTMLYNLDDRVKLIRASKEPFPLKDCIDFYGIIIASLILRHYHETNKIPNKYYFIPSNKFPN